MAIYTNLPVYKDSYVLLRSFCEMSPKMPRECRFSLGQDVRRKITEIIILIYRANRIRNKIEIIGKMRENMLEVQVYMRLMCDLRYISEKKYLEWVEQTAAISKQLAAWEKSETKKQSGDKCF